MGFVYKSGCIYVLITSLIWWLLKIKSLTKICKVAGYVSARCVCSLEEHTKKLEINLKDLLCPFIFVHKWWKFTGVIRSACVLHLNESTLYQVESTAISDFVAIILLGIWFYSFGFLFCANSLVNPVLCTFRMTEFKALSLVSHCRPLLCFSFWTICNIYCALYHLYVASGKYWATKSQQIMFKR